MVKVESLLNGSHRLEVWNGQKMYGVSVAQKDVLNPKVMEVAFDTLIDAVTKKEFGFTKTDLILEWSRHFMASDKE
jgi:hypothetical protein